ncbi:MAG TPA: PAS domain S-box protein [Smithella sp.]|nr:PAS domain S-box protein [Smithella sp.]
MKEISIENLIKRNKFLEKKNKELETALSEKKNKQVPVSSDQIYHTLFRLFPHSILVTKVEDGTIYDASDYFCRITGFSREEAIGKTTVELNLWLNHDREKIVKILLEKKRFSNLEVRHRMKDGSIKTCLDSGEMILIGGENYLISVETDITAQKDLENVLRHDQQELIAIMDATPIGVSWSDMRGNIKYTNRRFEELFGYVLSDIPSIDAWLVLAFPSQAYREKAAALMLSIMEAEARGEDPGPAEITITCKDGSVRHILQTIVITANRILAIYYDITKQKRYERELKHFAENLEEANIALRVLMNKRNVDQKDFEEKLQVNINDLVIPYLTKLRNTDLDDRNKNYLSVLESNLTSVLSPFMRDFRSSHKNLTPQEIQIVDLIMKGKNTKEIADMLNASVNTIATHRNNIRKKLNLRNSKINLRSYILSTK